MNRWQIWPFGMLMRRILERVRERMDEKGIVARLPVCGATPFATGRGGDARNGSGE